MRAYALVVLLHLAASVTGSPATSLKAPGSSLDSLRVDFVVDLDNTLVIQDVDEDEDGDEQADGGSAHSTQLCIAPPCGVNAAAVSVDDTARAPLPWILGLKPPEAI